MKQKNWIDDATQEIRESTGDLQNTEISEIIARHCPFEPDAAYVRVVPPEPGHVWDWAARAGAYLHAEGVRLSSHRITAVISHFAEPLMKLLNEARREHFESYLAEENDYDPCPKSYEDADEDEKCTCGADA